MITLRLSREQLLIPVRVTPKGGRDCVLPFQESDTSIRLKVSAPPEDGKANAAVIKLLASVLDIPKSSINVARGEQSREKQVAVSLSARVDTQSIITALASALMTTPASLSIEAVK